jgi:peptidoglycan lytic transglycosylase
MMRGRASSTLRRLAPFGACAVLCLLVANCAKRGGIDARYGVSPSARLVEPGEPVPKGGGVYRVGSPYMVGGRVYVPQEDPNYNAVGLASWYGADFHGRATANGEIFDDDSISAAHPTLPLPSYARVTNLSNGRSLIVRVNDRGPYHGNRIIDVSMRAAHLLGFTNRGIAWVRVQYVGRAPIEGSDDRVLASTLRENAPAPAPWDVRFAATPLVPAFPNQPPPVRAERLASSAMPGLTATDASYSPGPTHAMSFADPPDGGGTDQFLNGRGLY